MAVLLEAFWRVRMAGKSFYSKQDDLFHRFWRPSRCHPNKNNLIIAFLLLERVLIHGVGVVLDGEPLCLVSIILI